MPGVPSPFVGRQQSKGITVKTSRLVLAPAVAVAMTGLASAPAFAATESTASVSPTPVCAQRGEQSWSGPEDSASDPSGPDESDPRATRGQSQVTRTDIANKQEGIGFSGTGFSPDQQGTVPVVGTDGTED